MPAIASLLLLMLLAHSAPAQAISLLNLKEAALEAVSVVADALRRASIVHQRNPTYLHFVNSRAGEYALRANRRGEAFLRLVQAFYRHNVSTPLTLEYDDVCTRPQFHCGEVTRYFRTHDGTCNNLRWPGCGRANSALLRMLPASYADGIYKPRRAKSGEPLPSARDLQVKLLGERRIDSRRCTLYLMQHAQLVSHDMALSSVKQTASGPLQCCTSDASAMMPPSLLPDACYPIPIRHWDPVYRHYNVHCMEFVRAMTVPPDDCVAKPAVAMNAVTSHLDLSAVYGNSDTANMGLRKGESGRLVVTKYPTGDFLPLTENSPAPCNSRNDSHDVCFKAGDVRANQNPLMTGIHVLYLREHNRIADCIKELNPHWNDERIYQETRRIVIACYQHITYKEMLPIFIGHEAFHKYFQNYMYDEELCAGTFVEFTSVCFRYFHTLIHGILKMMNPDRKTIGELILSEFFNKPTIVIHKFKELLIGAITQPCRKEDIHIDKEVAHELFRPNRTTFGFSLPCFDMQRARDHGVPPYNELRVKCGLPRAKTFDDLEDTIPHASIAKMKKVYTCVDDIDPMVGAALENVVPGTMMGPTNLCIAVKQFLLTQKADKFFYCNKEQEYPFTEGQIKEIKKASVARLICDHTGAGKVQKEAFFQISKSNPLVDCTHIPALDLSLWKEDKEW